MKPDWCPSGVWETANGVCSESKIRHMSTGVEYGPIVIARALLAERERALEEAASRMLSQRYLPEDARKQLAAAILALKGANKAV